MFNIVKSNNRDFEIIENLLEQIENFIVRDINSIEIQDAKISPEFERLYGKFKKIANMLQEKSNKDLGLNGKMLIAIEKMSDGGF